MTAPAESPLDGELEGALKRALKRARELARLRREAREAGCVLPRDETDKSDHALVERLCSIRGQWAMAARLASLGEAGGRGADSAANASLAALPPEAADPACLPALARVGRVIEAAEAEAAAAREDFAAEAVRVLVGLLPTLSGLAWGTVRNRPDDPLRAEIERREREAAVFDTLANALRVLVPDDPEDRPAEDDRPAEGETA